MYLFKKNIHTTTMKTNIRFTFPIVKLIPFALLSQLRSLASSESNMASFFTSSLYPLEFCSSVSRQQCCSIDCIEYMQFGFRFQILHFTTSVRFSTKTLAYLAYKAFKAFMAFQAFAAQSVPKLPLSSIFQCGLAANNMTCVCVCKYFERLRYNPNTLKYKTTEKRVL